MSPDTVLDRIDADLDAAMGRLMELLRIPSISTDPAYRDDCRRAADWLVAELQALGFTAARHETTGQPMVVGQTGSGPGPHLLFYGHYDVQPADPLELWRSPPFEPRIEDTPKGRVIRARGAQDDKGQLMTFLTACRAWKEVHGALPGRLTVFFEGEEESGSPSLVPFMEANADLLRADLALICDTGLYADKVPAIITSLRGLLGEEVTITGPDVDLHSGFFGGLAANPARALARVIAGLHDETGRITLPGFYDGVREIDPEMLAQWNALEFDAEGLLGSVGLSVPAGETGKTPLQMVWSEPTCEVNGMTSGYTGAGFKTVLPSKASAKISFRLVGDQDPLAIRKAFREYVRVCLPADCRVEFADHGASRAGHMKMDHPLFEQARQALSEEWNEEAAFVGVGGSIPVAGHFQTVLGMDALLAGFGRSDDALHSPNEKYDVECFHKGARSWARILARIADMS